jgi:hypothetical protein
LWSGRSRRVWVGHLDPWPPLSDQEGRDRPEVYFFFFTDGGGGGGGGIDPGFRLVGGRLSAGRLFFGHGQAQVMRHPG